MSARASGSNKNAIMQRVNARTFDMSLGKTVSRDPCVRCGVRQDRHAALGCGRWVKMP